MNKFSRVLVLGICMGMLSGCIPAHTATPSLTQAVRSPCVGPTITIGDISNKPNEVISSALPLANYLADHLASFGFKCGNVVVPDTTDKLIADIKNGQVDIYMDSMYPAFLVSEATGAQPILRRWRNCDPDYYSVIFTAKDSGITSIQDLPGHMIAMDRSYSTSGFALPAIFLLDRGVNLAVKDTFNTLPAKNEAGIYFSLDDVNTVNLVLEGKVSAGVTDDYFFGKWEQEAPGRLVKLAETVSMPRQAVLVRSGLRSDLQEAIKKVLATAHLNSTGLSVIEQAAQTCKFDDTPEGIESAFELMRKMHARLKQIPGWQAAYLEGH
jgi:phosphonate transport system substrate-binding protein